MLQVWGQGPDSVCVEAVEARVVPLMFVFGLWALGASPHAETWRVRQRNGAAVIGSRARCARWV